MHPIVAVVALAALHTPGAPTETGVADSSTTGGDSGTMKEDAISVAAPVPPGASLTPQGAAPTSPPPWWPIVTLGAVIFWGGSLCMLFRCALPPPLPLLSHPAVHRLYGPQHRAHHTGLGTLASLCRALHAASSNYPLTSSGPLHIAPLRPLSLL